MILDSDVLIDLLRNVPAAKNWLRSTVEPPSICGIAALETLYSVRDAKELRQVNRFLDDFVLEWPYPEDTSKAHELAKLRLSHGFDLLDALIATCALRLDEPLATFNVKHFRAIPGLRLVQPYERG